MKFLKPSLNWLLIFLPISIWLEYGSGEHHTWLFVCACITIIPLAGWMGRATEHLAERTGEGIGGLLNATFGNAAELIIAIMALRAGKLEIVKASLTGSIIGNLLLVLGLAFLAGGLRMKTQKFNPSGARTQATLLILAAVGLVCPALFHHLVLEMTPNGTSPSSGLISGENQLSLWISGVLLGTYALGLVFTLRTHRQFFTGLSDHDSDAEHSHLDGPVWPVWKAVLVLLGSTALIAWISEFIVLSVEHAAHTLGMTQVFVGVIVVAVIGNAAEHSSAILMAYKNRMDLSLSIAIGSSIQIALFVAPVLVFLSLWIAPEAMSLSFSPPEVMVVVLTVFLVAQIAGDGESNWLEGVLLLAVYLIIGLLFYFLPETSAHVSEGVVSPTPK